SFRFSSGPGSQMRSAMKAASSAKPSVRRTPNHLMMLKARLSLSRSRRCRRFFATRGRAPAFAILFLAEGAGQLIVEGLHQVGEHGALAGLHEGLDRHAGHQLDVAEPRHFLWRQDDAHGVVALAGALVG